MLNSDILSLGSILTGKGAGQVGVLVENYISRSIINGKSKVFRSVAFRSFGENSSSEPATEFNTK